MVYLVVNLKYVDDGPIKEPHPPVPTARITSGLSVLSPLWGSSFYTEPFGLLLRCRYHKEKWW